MIEVLVSNLGRYTEGYLDSEYLKLPTTKENLRALLQRIKVDGVRYKQVFMTEYNTDIPFLCNRLGEFEHLDELNYLATLIDDMDGGEKEKFAAAVELEGHMTGAADLINLAQNLDCYDFYPGIKSELDLGLYYVDEMDMLEIPQHLDGYIDYEAYGRDMNLNNTGNFVTGGYAIGYDGAFQKNYTGRDDIPDDCIIFSYPEPKMKSIREELANYQNMQCDSPTPEKNHDKSSIKDAER